VKQSGGHVNIYSEEGRGTTVKIYLPRFVGDREPALVEADHAAEASNAGETILVVEDDEEVRAYSVEVLRDLGYHVLEAANGPSALGLLERHEGPLDLLFTDVVMPGMSGKELSDNVRRLRPDVITLFTSGYTGNAIVHGGRLDAGVELLSKPFTIDELSHKIQDLLDAGKGKRLLVAEGDPTIRLLTTEALTGEGYRVETAANAGELINKLRAAQGKYVAAILDAALPGKDFQSLLTEVQNMYTQMPLIMNRSRDASLSIKGERVVQIEKPYSAQQVLEALRRR
jgi:CheY-like chemotaxis protein